MMTPLISQFQLTWRAKLGGNSVGLTNFSRSHREVRVVISSSVLADLAELILLNVSRLPAAYFLVGRGFRPISIEVHAGWVPYQKPEGYFEDCWIDRMFRVKSHPKDFLESPVVFGAERGEVPRKDDSKSLPLASVGFSVSLQIQQQGLEQPESNLT